MKYQISSQILLRIRRKPCFIYNILALKIDRFESRISRKILDNSSFIDKRKIIDDIQQLVGILYEREKFDTIPKRDSIVTMLI